MDILITKLSALGDVLRTTSLLRPLLAKYPRARIHWVTSEAAYPMLEGNPHLTQALIWGPQAKRVLSGRSFDLFIGMEEDEELARFAARECVIADTVGVYWSSRGLRYTPASAPYYGMSLLNRDGDGTLTTADALKKANAKTYVQLWSGILGLPETPEDDRRPILTLTEEDRRAAAKQLYPYQTFVTPRIGLNSSAGERWTAKRLSASRAAALCKALKARFNSPVLVLGGPDEAERNAAIVREAEGAALDGGTAHPLRAFAAIIETLDALITSDSLAFHIANALARPAAVFVGPTSPTELDVFGAGSRLLPPTSCVDFYKARCTQEPSCLDRIPDEAFVAATENLIKK